MADAVAAKVWEKDKMVSLSEKATYKSWPREMLMWRARHRAGQAGFSDATKGLIPREIATDWPETEAPPPRPELRRPQEKPAEPVDVPARVVDPPAAELPAPGPAPEPEAKQEPPPAEAPKGKPPAPEGMEGDSKTDLISPKQIGRFFAIANSKGLNESAARKWLADECRISDPSKITWRRDAEPNYEAICKALEGLPAKAK
jgi:hypothetical protein